MNIKYTTAYRPSVEEYIEFLTNSKLGEMYPKERFEERLEVLLANLDISVVAFDSELIVGICFGITDRAYFLFVTDLGIRYGYERQGIGKKLMAMIHSEAGGEDEITMYAHADKDAIGFYEKCGMWAMKRGMIKECAKWTEFKVGDGYERTRSGLLRRRNIP